MSRHRGRSRPFARLRYIYPLHCACRCWHGVYGWREGNSIFDTHPVRTVAR